MRKPAKILISVFLTVLLLLSALIAVPYFVWGVNIFDLSGWHTTETGQTQYLDRRGKPLTDWQLIEESWYYFSPEDAAMVTGWLELEEGRYYLNADGTRHIGWLELSEGTYYLQPSDATAATGWLELEDATYYMDSLGAMHTGWLDFEGARYYFTENGTRYSGWLALGGNRHFFDENGIMATGWLETEEGRCYLDENGILRSGWTDTNEGRFFLTEEGFIATGWTETSEGTYYFDDNGQTVTGWLELESGCYYLGENGLMATGWQEIDGITHYFHENGIMAIGKVMIGEAACYFTSTGAHIQLVNTWNPVPEDYKVDLVSYNGWQLDRACYDSFVEMITALKSVGYYEITSAYRSTATQQGIWDRRLQRYMASGYSYEGALEKVKLEVAVPGTSEHHLGLAVDISAGEAANAWLAENSWRYGFIVRYPEGKTEITGIIYEPWHFRYVGITLAKELYDLGLCLEEYMDMLTEKAGSSAGTASNPENGNI